MSRFEKLGKGLELVKRVDGYHAIITIPMYDPSDTFLFTNDRDEAIKKAWKEYENLTALRG